MARWALVLAPPTGDPRRKVGGLPLALRLALDAQQAGAALIVTTHAATVSALSDSRLQIPATADAQGLNTVCVPANWVVHRSAFASFARSLAEGEEVHRDLGTPSFASESSEPFGFSPFEVKDSASARRAEQLLLRSLRKAADGWTARWLNRYISLLVTRLLSRTEIHPNHVSIVILAIGLGGAYLALQGDYWGLVLGALLFQAQSVLDGCDGELSRLLHKKSLCGEWLDTIGDDVTNYGFFAAAAYGIHAVTNDAAYLIAGAVVVVSGLVASGIEYRYLIRIGSGDLLRYPLGTSAASTGLWNWVRPLFKRDTFVLLTLIAAILGLVGPLLFVFALAAAGILVNVIAAELRMARERREAGAER